MLACEHQSSQIVIFRTAQEYAPIKIIDQEFPNSSNYSLDFTRDGTLLAHLSSNGNTI